MSDEIPVPALALLGAVLFVLVVYDVIMIPVFVKKDEDHKKIVDEIEGVKGMRKELAAKYKVL